MAVAKLDIGKLDSRLIPHNKLHPNPWNPNRMDDQTLKAERESIATFGFVDPVTVRPHPDKKGHFQIIDGEHRWKVLGEAKPKPEVPCIVLDLTDTVARKLTIVLNETRGQADTALLSSLLGELKEELGDELGVGLRWSDGELDSILKVADDDWQNYDPDGLGDKPPQDGDFHTMQVRLPADFVPVWEQAEDAIKDEGAELDADKRVANGQVLMRAVRALLSDN